MQRPQASGTCCINICLCGQYNPDNLDGSGFPTNLVQHGLPALQAVIDRRLDSQQKVNHRRLRPPLQSHLQRRTSPARLHYHAGLVPDQLRRDADSVVLRLDRRKQGGLPGVHGTSHVRVPLQQSGHDTSVPAAASGVQRGQAAPRLAPVGLGFVLEQERHDSKVALVGSEVQWSGAGLGMDSVGVRPLFQGQSYRLFRSGSRAGMQIHCSQQANDVILLVQLGNV
mmetsp:Transcript_87732/g.200500  ORF Transcript_87732/g.200500 Transcript_87732/m.200500 type:complete len:226 (+) Transcript_87732:1295-1972(+)